MKIILYLIGGAMISLMTITPTAMKLPNGELLLPVFFYFAGFGICWLYHYFERKEEKSK